MATSDLAVPKRLSAKGRKAVDVILRTAERVISREVDAGGCRAFYTPQEWEDRGEEFGVKSALVVVHDGGDLAPFFNLDYQAYDRIHEMRLALKEIGLYAESCTCWYSAVYKIQP